MKNEHFMMNISGSCRRAQISLTDLLILIYCIRCLLLFSHPNYSHFLNDLMAHYFFNSRTVKLLEVSLTNTI